MSTGEKGARIERIVVNTSIAVRSELGFYFGTARTIEGTRAVVEIAAPLEEGEAIEARITLSPARATALFRGRVARALVTAEGETPRFLLSLDDCDADDRAPYEGWLRNVKNRGTFSNFDTVVSTHESEGARSSAEIRRALEQMSRKAPGSASLFGPDSDLLTNPGAAGPGRGAVRDALRSAIARTSAGRGAPSADWTKAPIPEQGPGRVVATSQGGTFRRTDSELPYEPPPAPTPSVAPSPTAPPMPGAGDRIVRIGSPRTPSAAPPDRAAPSHAPRSQAPASHSPASHAPASHAPASHAPASQAPASHAPRSQAPAERPAHPPVRDPTYATTSTRTATWMEVQWHDPEVFERDARLQLCNYILVVAKAEAPLPDREPIRLAVRHGGFQLDCNATVRAMGPNGATYRLDFDALQIERLKAWLKDYGRK